MREGVGAGPERPIRVVSRTSLSESGRASRACAEPSRAESAESEPGMRAESGPDSTRAEATMKSARV
jgi:hypothetical protein